MIKAVQNSSLQISLSRSLTLLEGLLSLPKDQMIWEKETNPCQRYISFFLFILFIRLFYSSFLFIRIFLLCNENRLFKKYIKTMKTNFMLEVGTLANSEFFLDLLVSWWRESSLQLLYRVFEDLKFKISEDNNQNWSFPVPTLLAVSV